MASVIGLNAFAIDCNAKSHRKESQRRASGQNQQFAQLPQWEVPQPMPNAYNDEQTLMARRIAARHC
ncbi:MAG: hypothetical protein LIP03_14145 [Bacteroidales bacterium]|nr:hypothetical protein [Bacteroidales bacterium]